MLDLNSKFVSERSGKGHAKKCTFAVLLLREGIKKTNSA